MKRAMMLAVAVTVGTAQAGFDEDFKSASGLAATNAVAGISALRALAAKTEYAAQRYEALSAAAVRIPVKADRVVALKALLAEPDLPADLGLGVLRGIYSAYTYSGAADYKAIAPVFEAGLARFASGDRVNRKRCQVLLGTALAGQRKYAEAQEAFEGVLADYGGPADAAKPDCLRAAELTVRAMFAQGADRAAAAAFADNCPVFENPAHAVCSAKYAEQLENGYINPNVIPDALLIKRATLDDLAAVLMSADKVKESAFVEGFAARVMADCARNVRRVLAKDGQAFVGAIGQTNATARLQVVLDTLNAPAFAGLEEALKPFDLVIAPMDRAHVLKHGKELGQKILSGVLDAQDGEYLPHVYLALGRVEFDKWMKAYNKGGAYAWPY